MNRLRFLPVLLICLTFAGCGDSGSPTEPSPPANPNEVFYTSIGASDASGYGSSVPCVPFTDCPNGTGYVQTLTRRLKDTGKQVTLMNLGIPAAVLSPAIEELGSTIGRGRPGNFIDRETPFVPRNSTLITVFAGGNDINTVAEAVVRGQGGDEPSAFIATWTRNFGNDLKTLVSKIRERAPNARIVALNLPNFAGLPMSANFTPESKRVLQSIAVGFSAQVNALTSNGVAVIDLMCDGRSYQAGNYSPDGFHPNDSGYAFMTDLLWPAATTGSAPPPPPGCAPMTMF